MAVDLAKVPLWLATLAKEHPLTFVDHALRHRDSLVGLTQRQIEVLHWEDGAEPLQQGIETIELRKCVARVAELRRRIREADESVSDWDLRDWWDDARFELGKVRLFGDLVIGAFFEGSRPKERKVGRDEYAGAVYAGECGGYRESIEQRRRENPPLAPFHWEIEFPEVFERVPAATGKRRSASMGHSRGFDAIIGNPPFAGKTSVAAGNVARYPDWLKQVHAESHGNADLVAHFFRRTYDLVCEMGVFGLIATNIITQGDTRASGLRWIAGMERVLVTPQTSNFQALAFLPPKMVFGHTLVIFPYAAYSSFAVLQSRVHQIWSAFLGPTMKDDLRYTPSDCFETFPFPERWHAGGARVAERAVPVDGEGARGGGRRRWLAAQMARSLSTSPSGGPSAGDARRRWRRSPTAFGYRGRGSWEQEGPAVRPALKKSSTKRSGGSTNCGRSCAWAKSGVGTRGRDEAAGDGRVVREVVAFPVGREGAGRMGVAFAQGGLPCTLCAP